MVSLSNWFVDPIVHLDEVFVQLRDAVVTINEESPVPATEFLAPILSSDSTSSLLSACALTVRNDPRGLFVGGDMMSHFSNALLLALVPWSNPDCFLVVSSRVLMTPDGGSIRSLYFPPDAIPPGADREFWCDLYGRLMR